MGGALEGVERPAGFAQPAALHEHEDERRGSDGAWDRPVGHGRLLEPEAGVGLGRREPSGEIARVSAERSRCRDRPQKAPLAELGDRVVERPLGARQLSDVGERHRRGVHERPPGGRREPDQGTVAERALRQPDRLGGRVGHRGMERERDEQRPYLFVGELLDPRPRLAQTLRHERPDSARARPRHQDERLDHAPEHGILEALERALEHRHRALALGV